MLLSLSLFFCNGAKVAERLVSQDVETKEPADGDKRNTIQRHAAAAVCNTQEATMMILCMILMFSL